MSNTNQTETELGDDPHSETFATESNAAASTQKKASPAIKMVIIGFGVLFVALIGLFLYGFMTKGSAPKRPANTPAASAPKNPTEANPAAIQSGPNPSDAEAVLAGTEPTPGLPAAPEITPPPADPNDPLAATQPSLTTVDPTTGLTVDSNKAAVPAVNTPVVDPASLTATPPVIDNQAPAGVVLDQSAAQPVAPVVNPTAQTTSPVIATPAVENTPVPVVNVATDPSQTGAVAGAIDAARRDFLSGLSRIEESVNRLNGRVDVIDGRVARLESDIKNLQTNRAQSGASSAPTPTVPATNNVSATPASVKKPVVRKKKPVPAPVNRLEILDGSASVVRHRPIVPSNTINNRVELLESSASASRCEIRAIQPGRAWVRNSNGSFSSYTEGDELPNGKKVDKIDPERGIVAAGSAWSC